MTHEVSTPDRNHVTVNRTVFPVEDVSEVAALYADTGVRGSLPGTVYDVPGRRSITVHPRRHVSLGTYFNAFPASYWQRWTSVEQVRLTADLTGEGVVTVRRSTDAGRSSVVASRAFSDDTVRVDLPLGGFDDGGYYWFDITAGDTAVTLVTAEWQVPEPDGWTPGTATIGITTFNRPTYCLDQINAVGASPDVASILDRLVVVDQGGDLVSSQPGFAAAAARLGDRLSLIRQPNMGGSGGFSRTMLETVTAGVSRYVLLLDDDAICEPEAIARSVRFADFATVPTIVGGGMLHLDARAVLYTQGEVWNHRKSWMQASGDTDYDHDFAAQSLRDSAPIHRTTHADVNGWWMCLIPVAVLTQIGLSLPVFLKFDDIEFSLRAAARDHPTVCLPGVAVWHLAWHGKDTTRTWEEYFIHRNRIITGLLHSRVRRGGYLPLHSFLGDAKLLLMLQYSSVRIRHQALSDVFAGPAALPDWLTTRQSEIRALKARFADARILDDPATLPSVVPPRRAGRRAGHRPSGVASTAALAIRTGLRQLLTKVPGPARAHPQTRIAASDLAWHRFADVDSALVETADGTGVAWYQRDRATMRRFLVRSVRMNLRLALAWRSLAHAYRSGAPAVSSPEAWRAIFERAGASVDSTP